MPSKPPTAKQLAYLRALAEDAGQTFAAPRTRVQASSEIRRLRNVRTSGFTFAALSAGQAARDAHGDLTVVQLWDTAAHGSTAIWSQRS